MRIYLIASKGEQTAFKITTANALTDIDFVLDELVERFSMGRTYESKLINIKGTHYDIGYNIYYTELDDRTKTAKKLTGEVWREVLQEYVKNNMDEVKEAYKKRKKVLKERE